jgi:succinoglycan biosynthesis transport protein ExoP
LNYGRGPESLNHHKDGSLVKNSPQRQSNSGSLSQEQLDLLSMVGMQPQAEQESSQSNEVLQYLGVIWEKRWLVVFCVFIFLAVGALQLSRAVPIYTAVAVVRYEPTSLEVVQFADIGRRVNIHDELRTQMEIIRSGAVAKSVLEALGMDRDEPVAERNTELSPLDYLNQWITRSRIAVTQSIVKSKPRPISPEIAREQARITSLQNKVSLRRLQDTKLIEIIVRDRDNIKAAQIADEFANQFKKFIEDQKIQTYDTARDFLKREVQQAQEELEQIDNNLFAMNNKDDVRMLAERHGVLLENMAEITTELERKKNQLISLQRLANPEVAADPDVRIAVLSQNTDYSALDKELRTLLLQRVALEPDAGARNPELRNLNRRIEELQKIMKNMEENIFNTQVGKMKTIAAEIAALEESERSLEDRIQAVSLRMNPIRALELDRETKQQNYRTLLTRYEQVIIGRDAETGQVSITDRAKVPTFPTEPRVTRSLAIYTVMGFLFGCALALGLNFLDMSISDPRNVERTFGLPTLGLIPFMGGNAIRVPFGRRKGRRNVIRLIHTVDPYSSEAEAFRLLRTSLQYSTAGHSPQLIQVTSCFPSEGKSTAAANLAISFATLGERTLLMDADLKLPSLHRIFGVPKRPGLSDVLTGQMTSENVIVPTGIENLDIMPVGPKSPCPVELLESPMMTDIFDELRERYKTIIVDSTPLHGMSDAFVLGRKVDGVVLVVSVGRTRIDGFKKIVTQLQSMKARLLGVVYNHQNRVRRADRAYYYTGYYRYGTSAPDPEDRTDYSGTELFKGGQKKPEDEKIGARRD